MTDKRLSPPRLPAEGEATRRGFLKGGLIGSAALAGGGLLSSAARAAEPDPAIMEKKDWNQFLGVGPLAALGGGLWLGFESDGLLDRSDMGLLQPGQVSEPFQTQNGWHIVEFLGARQTDRTEEAIRQEARQKIMMQRADQEIEKVLRQFRDEAFVEIRLPGHPDYKG